MPTTAGKVNVVVDNVGAATWGDGLRYLAQGGRLLTVGGTTGYEAVTPVNLMFGKHLSIIRNTWARRPTSRRSWRKCGPVASNPSWIRSSRWPSILRRWRA